MRSKSILKASLAICIAAILLVAACGCEDLGAFVNTDEYYASFGDIVLIDDTSKEKKVYSIENYFYNEDSREDFLKGNDGAYKGVSQSDYVYMSIPFESDINMDSLALFIQSKTDVTVYISIFVADKIPSAWKAISDNQLPENSNGDSSGESSNTEKKYDDPAPETSISEVTVHLKNGIWNSFLLDEFKINGKTQKSIQINDGQFILLQIRNNSGVRVFDEKKQIFVDPLTGLELPKAEITMTNLLIRALEVTNGNEATGGD